MNKIYRLVFNRALRVMQVTSELARSHGGGTSPVGGKARRSRLAAAVSGACLLFGVASAAWAQSVDYAAIFEGDYVMDPDTAALYDWSKIRTWGMIIGYEQDSHLVIRNGLLVESAGVILGHNAGVSGQLDLIGPDTTLAEGIWSGEPLYVGLAGTGLLNVLEGAKVDNMHWLNVAWEAGSDGTVNVDGAGSELVHFEEATVGGSGAGRLNITNGGKVNVGNIDAAGVSITVAQQAGSTGTILVDGEGSLLEIVGNHSRIGDRGNGSLTVSNGGQVTSDGALRVGYRGGEGTIDVTGSGSSITANGLHVGYGTSSSSVSITDGARFDANQEGNSLAWLNLGVDAGATGSLLVEGAGTTLDAKGNYARIGYEGKGELTVRDGASVSLGTVVVGNDVGASGTVLVTGDGTRLTTGDDAWVYIGNGGNGEFQILDGAEVSLGNLVVGASATDEDEDQDPSGSVLVSGEGTVMNVAGELVVADDQAGTLVVENGASVKAGSLLLERDEDGNPSYTAGELRITGAGTRFETTGEFMASAHFSLTEGARLETGSAGIGVNYATGIGDKAVISGADTVWNNAGELIVNTAVDITDGAQVSTGTLQLESGSYDGFAGTRLYSQLRVLGDGTLLTTTGDLMLGDGFLADSETPGYLVLADGGQLQAGGDIRLIGGGGLAFGTMLAYDEANASVIADPQAPGSLNADARLVFTEGAGSDNLVFNHTSDGLVLSNTMVSEGYAAGERSEGGITSLAGTTRLTGDLSQFASGINVTGGKLVLDSDVNVRPENYDLDADQRQIQAVDVSGGMLVVNRSFGFDMSSSANNTSYGGTSAFSVHAQGTLGGAGRIFGTVEVFDGGHIAPGDGNAATLAIDGNLTFGKSGEEDTTAFYDVDIRGNGTSDKLDVFGIAQLDQNGVATTVNVNTLDPGTSYQDGQQYTILTASGGVEGTFDKVLSNSAFLTPTLTYDTNNVLLGIALNTSNIDMVVKNGEVLSGSGAWASIEVQSGGAVSPGSSSERIGTISATGPVKFTAGSFYDVDIKGNGGASAAAASGSSDLLSTTGAATLDGGTVRVTALDPETSYQDGQQYTILSADGGVTGTFADALSHSAFLTPSLSYDANHVLLKIALKTSSSDGIVENGEILSGTGSYDGIDVRSGGTVSPGASGSPIGTITATGPVKFASGSFYDVDIKGDGASDLLSTTGTATLAGGTVRVNALDPQASYQDGQSYTFLNADGGLSGTFADVISRSAFIDPSLSYDQNHALLTIALKSGNGGGNGETPPPIFETVATTRNQYNIAYALDTLPQSGDGLALYNKLLMLSAQEARDAFGSLSGEVHLATRTALLDDRFLREGIGQQLSGSSTDQAGDGIKAWVGGSAASGNVEGDGNAARAGHSHEGLMAGVDWALSDQLTIGAALGVDQRDVRVPAWESSADVGARHLGVYAAARWDALSVHGGISHAWYDVDSVRHAAVASAHLDRLDAGYDASATTMFAEGGWDLTLGRTVLTPYLAVAHTRLKTDGTTEQGGITALEVAGSKDELLTATAGARASWAIGGSQEDDVRLQAGLAWQNVSGELKPDQRARFVAGGDGFTVYGAPLARDMAVADLGLSVRTSDMSNLWMSVQGRFGDDQSEGGAQLQWNWRF